MRLLIGLFTLIGLVAVFLLGTASPYRLPWSTPWTPAPSVVAAGPTVLELEQMGDLVTLKVNVAEVLVGEGEGYRGSFLIKGDALLAINLDGADVVTDDANREATILLPPPRVTHPRVDHERTLTWDINKTTWNPMKKEPRELRDTWMRQAQRLVEHAAKNDDHVIEEARRVGVRMLEGMYRKVGWQIQVVWRDRDGQRVIDAKRQQVAADPMPSGTPGTAP